MSWHLLRVVGAEEQGSPGGGVGMCRVGGSLHFQPMSFQGLNSTVCPESFGLCDPDLA